MSDPVTAIIVLVIAYLVGAIPSGVLAGRLYRGVDIRSYGSGGSGATNVARTLGPRAGAAVFVADLVKGMVVISIARYAFSGDAWLIAAAGSVAVIGHMYPVYIRFKGGKGVATGFGALIVISPLAGFIALVGVAIAALSRYVSLGSIIGTSISLISLMVFSVFKFSYLGYDHDYWWFLFAVPVGALIIWSHQSNIDRLAKGDESRLENKPSPRRAERTP